MGKLLDKYTAEYNAAIAPAKGKQGYVAKPEIWMYFKWEKDNNVFPWEDKYSQVLKETTLQDPEFGLVLMAGFAAIASVMDDMQDLQE